MKRKACIFVDGENLRYSLGKVLEATSGFKSEDYLPKGADWQAFFAYNLFDCKLGKEKTVDVKLALDTLVLEQSYDVAIIVSGDQDYVPAVQVLKDRGKVATRRCEKIKYGNGPLSFSSIRSVCQVHGVRIKPSMNTHRMK